MVPINLFIISIKFGSTLFLYVKFMNKSYRKEAEKEEKKKKQLMRFK